MKGTSPAVKILNGEWEEGKERGESVWFTRREGHGRGSSETPRKQAFGPTSCSEAVHY